MKDGAQTSIDDILAWMIINIARSWQHKFTVMVPLNLFRMSADPTAYQHRQHIEWQHMYARRRSCMHRYGKVVLVVVCTPLIRNTSRRQCKRGPLERTLTLLWTLGNACCSFRLAKRADMAVGSVYQMNELGLIVGRTGGSWHYQDCVMHDEATYTTLLC